MPACPSGSRIKPSELQEYVWYYAENVLPLVTIQRPYLAPFVALQQAVLLSLEDLCGSEPGPLPELDWAEILLYAANPVTHLKIGEWLLAFYKQQIWSTFCECNPGTGTGPCPPIAKFGAIKSANWLDGYTHVARVPAPYGWFDCNVTKYRGTDGQGDGCFVDFTFEKQDMTPLVSGPGSYGSNLTEGTQSTYGNFTLNSQANRNLVRWLSLWVRAGAAAPQNASTKYPFNVSLSVTFNGTCSDVPVPFPPPVPEPEPEAPPFPPPPGPGGTCDVDALCAKLDTAIGLLTNINTVATAHQLYDAPAGYELGELHSGLYGTSTFPISKLIGVAVDITSPLPSRQLEGQPKYLWDVGWMSIGTADGMLEELRVTRDTQVWQPRHMREATSFGWALKPGIVMNVRELRAQQF